MLSAIAAHWPPAPGPNQPETGHKTLNQQHAGTYRETLVGLHEPAWWTGLRLATPANQPPMQFRVRLLKLHDEPAFKMAADVCTWTQASGEWVQFPWAIPAMMANIMGLQLEITPLDMPAAGAWINTRIAFHEVPDILSYERLLFFNENGKVQHFWDGRQHVWGNPQEGAEPRWQTIHTPVPPSSRLGGWNDNRLFCIHEWDEVLNM
jgi:hypothetical protein